MCNCFNRIGMHIPSFLYRVFLLLTEFNSFQEKAKNRFPVAPTTNFALYVCNNREPSQHGLQRCIDIKDALLSLIQKGHQLSSATLLSGSDMLASPHRHVSMDSSDVLFQSFEPSIQSHTPLLHPHSYFESRAYSVEDLPDSSWTSEFSFSNNLSSLPAVSTSALPTRPFELSDSGEAELWNQPIPMWTSQERSLRHSVGSGSLFRDSPAERRRSNSVNVIHSPPSLFRSTYSSTPLSAVPSSFNFFTPSQGSLSFHDVDRIDDFSLGERAMYKRSIGSEDVRSGSDLNLEENLHLMKPLNVEPPRVTSTLNPNSAEFIPNSKKAIKPANRSETDHGKPGVKRRDLLEQTMLQQRIVENRILTLKLRGLPYTATKEEIAAFFAPLSIPRDSKGELSIVIGQDSLQRPSGEAFVTFSSVEDSVKGLEYHLKNLGKRYIEIFPLFNKEYYRRNSIYCSICNKYGHMKESCVLRSH